MTKAAVTVCVALDLRRPEVVAYLLWGISPAHIAAAC